MIRKYKNVDRHEVLDLFRLNTPEYFDPSEKIEFIEYLDNQIEDYFVSVNNSRIIGCGGINYFSEEKLARISWDMIHPDFQGRGIGKELTQYRINFIKNNSKNIDLIVVRTTQLVYKFYEKISFVLEKTEKDFWAKGFDLYQMELKIISDGKTEL